MFTKLQTGPFNSSNEPESYQLELLIELPGRFGALRPLKPAVVMPALRPSTVEVAEFHSEISNLRPRAKSRFR